MKTLTTIKRLTGAALALTMLATASFAPSVSAVQYDPNGTSTSKTPVFNHITGVPGSVGNEADFVRVRPKASTDNAAYVDNLTADCANNSAYTVRTYVHNGADPKYNTEENAIAVARGVVAKMTAPLNTTNNKFEFKSTISSTNTASVSDTGYLTCANGKTVKLTLVANSVQTYSKPLGFQTAPDASVNGSLPLGSRVQGDGNVFACWDDRIIVTYDVKVEEAPVVQPSLGECKLVKVEGVGTRKIKTTIEGTTSNAAIVGYRLDYGDGTKSEKQVDEHTYAKDGSYTITAEVLVKYADGKQEWKTAATCKTVVNVKGDTPPTTPPVNPGTPPTLPETGPAGVAAVAIAVSVMSVAGYYYVSARRAARI